MDKKKLTIILGAACAIVLIVAIALIAAPKDEITPGPNDQQNEVVDNNTPNNGDDISANVPIVNTDEIRKDGEKTVPVILNGKTVGDAKILTKNGIFHVNVKDLNATGAINFEEKDGSFVWETERFIYTIKENSITSFDKDWEKIQAEIDASNAAKIEDGGTVETTDTDDGEKDELGAERTFEMLGYIKHNNETYLVESVITFIGVNSYINDKGVTIVTEAPKETNSTKIEATMAMGELVDMEAEDFTKLGEAFFNGKLDFIVESYGPVNSKIDNDAIKEVLFNAFNNSDNMIYSKKIDNKYIVMCDENVATALMNTMLGSVSKADLYTNVRLVVETDDSGNIEAVYGDSYYIFDGRDIYYYITGNAN